MKKWTLKGVTDVLDPFDEIKPRTEPKIKVDTSTLWHNAPYEELERKSILQDTRTSLEGDPFTREWVVTKTYTCPVTEKEYQAKITYHDSIPKERVGRELEALEDSLIQKIMEPAPL